MWWALPTNGWNQWTHQQECQEVKRGFEAHRTNFYDSESVFNVIIKKRLSSYMAEQFLAHDVVGEKRYNSFIAERMEGEASIWDPIKKRKLPIFKENIKSTKGKAREQLVQVKEEGKLMSRFIIASRSCFDINFLFYFGQNEFSVIP